MSVPEWNQLNYNRKEECPDNKKAMLDGSGGFPDNARRP